MEYNGGNKHEEKDENMENENIVENIVDSDTGNTNSNFITETVSSNKKSGKGVLIAGVALIIAVIAVIIAVWYNTEACRVPSELITDVVPQAEVVIELDEHWKMSANVKSAAVEMRTKSLAIDLTGIEYPEAFDIFDSYLYVENFNADGTEQSLYYVSKTPTAINGMTLEDVTVAAGSVSNDVKENVINHEDSTQVEYLTSMYKEGYIYNANAFNNSIERQNVDLNEVSKFSSKDVEGIKINIEGLGTFNLDDLDIFTGEHGVLYSTADGMITLFDETGDFSAVWITYMQNDKLGNMFGEMIPVEGYNNVYVDIGFKNNADFGYGGFSVMTEAGMYYFKVSEVYADPIAVATEVLRWLEVDFNAEVIDLVAMGFEFPFTIDDMLEPNTTTVGATE